MTHVAVMDDIDPLARDTEFGNSTQTDAQETFDRLRDAGRKAARVKLTNGERAYAILGFETVQQVFQNEAEIPAAHMYIANKTADFYGDIVNEHEGPDHRWHRAMFGAPLIPKRVREIAESVLAPVANEMIDRFGTHRRIDFIAAFAHSYPFNVISAMLGIPRGDWEKIEADVRDLLDVKHPELARKARDAMAAYLRDILEERRRNPGDDLISELAQSEVDGRRYTDKELGDAVRFLYPVSGENTLNAVGTVLYYALSEPGVFERLKANPKDRTTAVEETLRIRTPLPYMPRHTFRSITIGGVEIPANSHLLLSTSSANRDPARFDDPTRFSLDRGPINHITFGSGPHFCPGAHLARAEARMMLDLVIQRLPGLRLVPDQEFVFYGSPTSGLRSLLIEFDDLLPAAS